MTRKKRQSGFSLLELVVVMLLSSLLFSMALFDAQSYGNKALNTASNMLGFFKTVRAKALATTQAFTVRATSANSVATTFASACSSADQTADSQLSFELPAGVVLQDSTWSFCYSPRGLADTSLDIVINDSTTSHTVQLVLGGAARVI